MSIKVTTYAWVPPFAQGLVRDLRVRWALEEAGLSYEEHLIAHADRLSRAHREQQPFAQVPVYEEEGLVLFESGAIVLHIAERSESLLPRTRDGRAQAQAWLFAALNTVEPPIQNLMVIDLFCAREPWAPLRRPGAMQLVETRLDELSAYLQSRNHLVDERFTAADLMMVTVLRVLRHTDLVQRRPALHAYQQRCEARPAFAKALADQLAVYARHAPP